MVHESIRVDDQFIRQTLDPLGNNRLSELFRVGFILWNFYVLPVRVVDWVRFYVPPDFYVFFFSFFNNIYEQLTTN